MKYKNLGNTDIKVSCLGFGGGIGGANSANANYEGIEKTLLKAMELGVNFIDTSPVYGQGESEKIIGKTIKKNKRRNDVVIATKVLPGETSFKGIVNSVEGSLRRLNTNYIDLYQVHWPNPSIPFEETARGVEKVFKEGKIRSFGVSNFSFSEIKKMTHALKDIPIASIQAEYNFCERSIENKIIPYCLDENMTVIAYTPLMRGKMASTQSQINLLKNISERYKKTVGQIILNWMSNIDNMVVLTTTKKMSRVIENFTASEFDINYEDRQKIRNECLPLIQEIDTKFILKSSSIERSGYLNLQEAIQNKNNWSPSPSELADQMKKGEFLKPIRLRKSYDLENNCKLEILEGKLRFWAWVVAFGWDKKIKSLIWEE
jgi:aryl-alcohol dehydrogenase-like predicted oxidoreductase